MNIYEFFATGKGTEIANFLNEIRESTGQTVAHFSVGFDKDCDYSPRHMTFALHQPKDEKPFEPKPAEY